MPGFDFSMDFIMWAIENPLAAGYALGFAFGGAAGLVGLLF